MIKNRIEILPGKFIQYEISEDLIHELSLMGVDAQEEIELACKDFADMLKERKDNAPTED